MNEVTYGIKTSYTYAQLEIDKDNITVIIISLHKNQDYRNMLPNHRYCSNQILLDKHALLY